MFQVTLEQFTVPDTEYNTIYPTITQYKGVYYGHPINPWHQN